MAVDDRSDDAGEVPAYVDEATTQAAPELEVPRVIGIEPQQNDEIDLPDFLR